MAAQTLLGDIEARRKSALAQLDSDFQAKTADLQNKTEQERSNITESAKKQAVELSQRERIRVEGAAKLQSKKMIFDATEKMLENNLEILRQSMVDFAASKDYSDLLPAMVEYASKRLGGEIRVTCRREDVAIMKKTGAEVTSSSLNAVGGFKAEKKDGTQEIDLTFDEILRSRDEEVRAFIMSKE